MPAVVVHAGDAQKHGGYCASLVQDDFLSSDFRLRICPRGFDRRVFGEELARRSWPVDEHRAREDELLDLKIQLAQALHDAGCALDSDLVVLRARFPEEVVVGGEMDNRGNVSAMVLADRSKAAADALVRGDFNGDMHAVRWGRSGCFAVEADDVG